LRPAGYAYVLSIRQHLHRQQVGEEEEVMEIGAQKGFRDQGSFIKNVPDKNVSSLDPALNQA
jgi:hypothetical protein